MIIIRLVYYIKIGIPDKDSQQSYKSDVSSAGIFVIGKAATFANSDLRMVFCNTK